MAERRMFAKSVIGSARFLTMPPSSRLLYYDLGMMADDDGIVEAFTVMRTTGAAEDDLKVLVSKGFVSILNEELVSLIIDWSRNNQIRRDRYQPSVYRDLLVKFDVVNQWLPDGLPNGNQRLTQCSIGKYSVGEESVDKSMAPPAAEPAPASGSSRKGKPVRQRYGEYQNVLLSAVDLEKLKGEFPDWQERIERLSSYMASTGKSYKNHLATIRNWARTDNQKGATNGKTAIGADQRPEIGLYL